MAKQAYFLTRNHAIDVGEMVARALGKTAVFSTYERKPNTCPEHYVAIVQCRHVTVRCFREDYFEAQFCDSTNSCTSTRATSWEEALRELRAQLVLMRDGYQEGIEILDGPKQ